MELRRRHWLVALVLGLTAHAGLLLLFHEPPISGARSSGMGGMQIALGPAGGAPGAAAVQPREVTAEAAQEVEPAETTAEPVEAAVQAQPIETVESAEVAAVEPIPEKTRHAAEEVALEPQPQPMETVEAVDTAAVEPPPVAPERPVPPPEAVAKAVPPPVAPAQAPEPVRSEPVTRAPEPVQAEAAVRATDTDAERITTATQAPGSRGEGGSENVDQAGSGDRSAGGGNPGLRQDYLAQLQAWLERHRRYPRRAQLRRQEGTALLYFVIDRDGNVLDYRIQRSSGYRVLDREVREMLDRARPLPPVPPELRQAQLELLLPIQFALR